MSVRPKPSRRRRAGDHPGPPVPVDQLARRARSPASSTASREAQSRRRRLGAAACSGPAPTIDEPGRRAPRRARWRRRARRSSTPFCGISRATATTRGSRSASPPGVKRSSTPLTSDRHALGIGAGRPRSTSSRDESAMVTSGAGAGTRRGTAKRSRRWPTAAPGAGSRWCQMPRCTWWTSPTWGTRRAHSGSEERDAVEDLDDAVARRRGAPRRSSQDGAREHADAGRRGGTTRTPSRSTSAGPPRHPAGVVGRPRARPRPRCRAIGAACTSEPPGLGVVEVPEGQQVHALDPASGRPARPSPRWTARVEVGGGDRCWSRRGERDGRSRDCGPTGGSLIYAPLWMPRPTPPPLLGPARALVIPMCDEVARIERSLAAIAGVIPRRRRPRARPRRRRQRRRHGRRSPAKAAAPPRPRRPGARAGARTRARARPSGPACWPRPARTRVFVDADLSRRHQGPPAVLRGRSRRVGPTSPTAPVPTRTAGCLGPSRSHRVLSGRAYNLLLRASRPHARARHAVRHEGLHGRGRRGRLRPAARPAASGSTWRRWPAPSAAVGGSRPLPVTWSHVDASRVRPLRDGVAMGRAR